MKTWNEVRTRQHDISGIENPGNWLFEEKNGIWYPKEEPDQFESLEKPLIESLLSVLWEHREQLNEAGTSTNTIQWIDETMDLVEVCFLGNIPEGDNQERLNEEGEFLTFKEALKEIFTRLENSNYFEQP